MGQTFTRSLFLKCVLIVVILFNDLISVWILIQKNPIGDLISGNHRNETQEDSIHPILTPLYSMLSILFSVLFGCTGIYYSSEALIAIYSILTVISVPISVLVMLRIKVYVHVVFNCIICMLSLLLLHNFKDHKDRDPSEAASERSVINRNNSFTPYCLANDFTQMLRPPKYQDIGPPLRPPNYEDLFGDRVNKFVATV